MAFAAATAAAAEGKARCGVLEARVEAIQGELGVMAEAEGRDAARTEEEEQALRTANAI